MYWPWGEIVWYRSYLEYSGASRIRTPTKDLAKCSRKLHEIFGRDLGRGSSLRFPLNPPMEKIWNLKDSLPLKQYVFLEYSVADPRGGAASVKD